MHKTFIAWASAAVLGMAALAGPALAQTATRDGSGAQDKKEASKSAKRQAAADLKAAQAGCHSRRGADRKTCLDEVRARHRESLAETGGKTGAARQPTSRDAVPAVQTQSSTVGATGVAPSTTGPDPTPGTTAVPRK